MSTIKERKNAASARLITDLRGAVPAPQSGGQWEALPYRCSSYSGYMLRTVARDAPTLRLPLVCSGWHAVSLVISHALGCDSYVEARLTGEEKWYLVADAFCRYGPEEALGTRGVLHEEPWRLADLTGKDLEIRFPEGTSRGRPNSRGRNTGGHAALYAVRLMPLSGEDAAVAAARRHRPLTLFSPPQAPFYSDRFAPDEWDAVNFNNWVLGGANYPSTVITSWPQTAWMLPPYRRAREREAGEDPLSQCIEKAHAAGNRFWMTVRPQSWCHAVPPRDQRSRSPFFVAHPEYRCLEADGTPLSTLSVTFAPVRDFIRAVFAEALDRGADGITVMFNRGFALARYEQPVRDRFRALYGLEARDVADLDPRLHRVWAEFITAWIRELRQLADASGPTPLVARRELNVITGPCLEWNLAYGIDVEAWAREGLVDHVIPYPLHTHTDRIGSTAPLKRPQGWIDIGAYARVLKHTGTRLIPSLGDYCHPESLATLRQRAHDYYQAGADGVCRWDNEECMAGARLDDPEIQRLWQVYWPPTDTPLVELDGLRLDAFAPATAFV